MGIKNLKKFLRGEYKTGAVTSNLVSQTHISHFKDQRMAIDISSYLYKYKITCGDSWLKMWPTFLSTLRRYHVHGVFIFDGAPPVEKLEECRRRRQQVSTMSDKLVQLRSDLDQYVATGCVSDLLRETSQKISEGDQRAERIGKLLHSGIPQVSTNGEVVSLHIDVSSVSAYIEKKMSQNISITREDCDRVKEMFDVFGVPWIQAPGEAEALAAYLYSIGDVSAVLTEDTDILAYGVGTYISGFNSSSGECSVVYLEEVLSMIELTYTQFLDFCISCGCDYGDNIPGIGVVSAYRSIVKHGSIDGYVASVANTSTHDKYLIMNHIAAREIFTSFGRLTDREQYHGQYWDSMINLDSVYSYLARTGCKYSESMIHDSWTGDEIIFDD